MIRATPILRAYAAFRGRLLARMDPARTQRRQLQRLVREARTTRFGRDHGFDEIRSVEDFQRRVPLRRYEDFWNTYWKDSFPTLEDVTWPGRIPYFAVTSGTTTGKQKYIPVSRRMVSANKRAVLELLTFHLAARPDSRVLDGKNFMLGGSTAMVEEAPGIFAGDLSGIAAREVPRWARPFYFPPPDLARIADWEEKMAALGPRSLEEPIRTVGGTTNWMLLFFDQLGRLRPETPGRLADLYPALDLVVYGGVSFAPYRGRFERLLEGSRAELREVYPASEGFVAVADRGPGEGLRMLLDNGLFFEFVRTSDLQSATPPRFWIGNVERDVDYAVVLSSCAGVWAYVLGDTVRFVDLDPPRLLISGRTSYSLSAFGEHLIGEEIERAVLDAARKAIGQPMNDFSVGPVFNETGGGTPGGHLYVVEFAGTLPQPEAVRAFQRVLDERLSELNQDYRDHRAGGFGMDPPKAVAAPEGTFAAWMRDRGKLGGQHKVPRVMNEPGRIEELARYAQGPAAASGGTA